MEGSKIEKAEEPEGKVPENQGLRTSFLISPKEKFKKTSEEILSGEVQGQRLEEEIEMLLDASEGWANYGWEFVCEENGVTITRTSVPKSPLKCTKGVAVMKASPIEVYELVRNIEIYKTWDPKIVESKLIRKLSDNTSINYLELAPWFPVSARDVCFIQYVKKEKNGTYIVAWRSVEDPLVPKKRGVVRALMSTSGFVITPLQRQSLVTFVLQFDLKGWIPTALMNQVTATQPMILAHIEKELIKKKERT
jgi:hypothetical protein